VDFAAAQQAAASTVRGVLGEAVMAMMLQGSGLSDAALQHVGLPAKEEARLSYLV